MSEQSTAIRKAKKRWHKCNCCGSRLTYDEYIDALVDGYECPKCGFDTRLEEPTNTNKEG